MRMAVTGRRGQVVKSLVDRGAIGGYKVMPLGRPELDLASHDGDTMLRALDRLQPDIIVSAAAYTAVDRAESERDLAFTINADGAGRIAAAAVALGVPLIHLSTDYVFDGSASVPYAEDAPTGPTGIYGASKMAGEKAVLESHPGAVVLRTAWVYSPFGANFVKTMLRLAHGQQEVRVVADQHGNPTSAFDIADGILTVANNLLSSDEPALRGLFHMTGAGETSWAGLAEAAFIESYLCGGPFAEVRHITTADYRTSAQRPANSRLDCRKLEKIHGVRLASWKISLREVVQRLLEPKLMRVL